MSVDTGAGTPLTAEEKIAGLDAWAASDAPDEEWAGVRKDTWRLARSRPATDPAGLDACPYCAAWHALDHNADNAR